MSPSTKIKKIKKIDKPIGIYDPEGENINPLTKEPYQNLYKHIQKTIDGNTVPATYANLANIWKTKLVYVHKDQILYSIQNNQVTLAKAGTGVGKTVLIPKIALHAFNYDEKVICTIPKKVITRTTAEFAAQCLDVKIGEEVGYYFRGSNKTSDKSKLIFTTTGSLISKITGSDPYLQDYKCVIIDEAHERTVQTDLLLLLLKKAMMKRKDLKVVIMSATINLKIFSDYFPSPQFKFGEVDAGEFTSHPIKDFWLDKTPKPNEWKDIAIEKIMKILKQTEKGDILVFVKASGDGRTLCQSLMIQAKSLKNQDQDVNPFCVVLAGNSSKEDEHLATDESHYLTLLDVHGKQYTRKVVMATNVAESSLTVDGVVFVVDCGLEYEESYDPHTMSRCLSEEFIAESGMKQRRGRGGRTQPGVCFHLYTKQQASQFQKYPTPSIQKSDLTSDMLDLMKMDYINNVKQLKQFLNEFISPPKKIFINTALNTLVGLGAFTSNDDDGKITDLGYAISKFRAIKPHLAKSLIASYYYKCSRSVCDIIAMIIICDGMINSVYVDYRDDKRKSPAYNKNQRNLFNKSRQLLRDERGDIMTLLNTFDLFKEQSDALKAEKRLEEDPPSSKPKSIVDIIKKNNIDSVPKSSKSKSKKSVKLMKMLNVPKSIIEESKKMMKEKSKSKSSKEENKHLKTSSKKSKKVENKQEVNKLNKWCVSHFIQFKKMARVQQISKQLHQTVKEVFRMHNLIPRKKSRSQSYKSYKSYKSKKSKNLFENENTTIDIDNLEPSQHTGGGRASPLNKYFEDDTIFDMDEDDRIIYSLLEGMFINIAVKNDKNYKACFPTTKTNSKINMDSFLKNQTRFVFYDELFMFNKGSSTLKLNIVNSIPDKMIPSIKEKYKSMLGSCFNAKKSSRNRSRKRTRKRSKKNRRKSLKRGRRQLKTFKRKRRH